MFNFWQLAAYISSKSTINTFGVFIFMQKSIYLILYPSLESFTTKIALLQIDVTKKFFWLDLSSLVYDWLPYVVETWLST